jgi:hypothetical protein
MAMLEVNTSAQPKHGSQKGKTAAKILNLVVTSGTVPQQRADLILDVGGQHKAALGTSSKGPFDAIADAVHQILGRKAKLLRYKGTSDKEGTDAEGTIVIWVEIEGFEVRHTAKSTDTNLAFARAYVGVFNR